ncbi:MAG: ankyrin repeat domain-containing protein [Rhodospirillaceae bacterium]|nr:ankyrin repeat domain-containing protein [Rhodospirillaceae bacterium]
MKKILILLLACVSFVIVYDQLFDGQDEETLRNAVALAEASRSGDAERLKFLIDNGADVNSRGKYDRTPLHWANTSLAAKILVNEGAKVDARDSPSSMTPLHLAAYYNNVPVVEALLTFGAKIEAKNYRGATPLHLAASNLHPATVIALLQAGADVNSINEDGATPLHSAARGAITIHKRKLATIQALLKAGANTKSRTKDGLLPSDYLVRNDTFETKERSELLGLLDAE